MFAAGGGGACLSSLAPVQSAGDLSQASDISGKGGGVDDGPVTSPLTERDPSISVVRAGRTCR